jgi:hypothetical protein
MGVCLQKSGIDTTKWNIRRCWHHPKQDAHFLSAHELANALSDKMIPGVLSARIYSGSEVFNKIRLQHGIIFFENYYGPAMQGDHIDLWNGRRLTDWLTWARINIRVGDFGLHNLGLGSDFQRAQSVWFWTVV